VEREVVGGSALWVSVDVVVTEVVELPFNTLAVVNEAEVMTDGATAVGGVKNAFSSNVSRKSLISRS